MSFWKNSAPAPTVPADVAAQRSFLCLPGLTIRTLLAWFANDLFVERAVCIEHRGQVHGVEWPKKARGFGRMSEGSSLSVIEAWNVWSLRGDEKMECEE